MHDIAIRRWIESVDETPAPPPSLLRTVARTHHTHGRPQPPKFDQERAQRHLDGTNCRVKRQLSAGPEADVGEAVPRPKRPRQHYPTPKGDCEEALPAFLVQTVQTDMENDDRRSYEAYAGSEVVANAQSSVGVDVDVDQTPRASNSNRLRFVGGAAATASPSSSAASRSSRSSMSTTSSNGTKRSRMSDGTSPSKRAVLGSLARPIRFPVFRKDTVRSDAAAGMHQLYQRVRQFESGQGVLPAADKDRLEQEGHADPMVDLAHVYFDQHHYRASLGGTAAFEEIDRLVNRARQFRQLDESEAAWNCYVDAPLFLLAEAASPHRGRVTSTNITTAKIDPTSLIQNTRTSSRLEGKMVDFALVLEESDATKAAVSRLPPNARQGVFSFNHTLHSPLLHRPIAVGVETKRQGENFQDALTQLGIWASAHFARLTELLVDSGRAEVHPPMLPMLVAQGSDWKFLLAEKTVGGDVNIWNKVDVGDVATHRGVYTTISVLLLLIDWAEKEYRNWFEANVSCAIRDQ